MDHQEAWGEGEAAHGEGSAGQGYGRGAKGQGKDVGEDYEGTVGDEETGHAEHAKFDSGVETGELCLCDKELVALHDY